VFEIVSVNHPFPAGGKGAKKALVWAQMAQSVFFGPSAHKLNASRLATISSEVKRIPGAFVVPI